MDPVYSQIQWGEDYNTNFMTQRSSPFSGISMDSGYNDSPTFTSLQEYSPNYENYSPMPTTTHHTSSNQSYHQYENYSSPTTTTQNWFAPISTEPIFLEIQEQPNENFRFRYPTEMQGPHGTIKGTSNAGNRNSKSFPTVILHNFNYNSPTTDVVIKCSLYQAQKQEDENERSLHPHKLAMRPAEVASQHDPHYVKVSKQNNYTAIFCGLGVIQTKKEQMVESLVNKIKKEKEFEQSRALTPNEIEIIRADAKMRAKKKIEINTIALGFTAFMKDALSNEWIKITETVYSTTINNEKSVNGKLSIARMSVCKGEAQGGTEIFMFVTKVDKNTIQVRFFETEDKEDPHTLVQWEANGIFSPSDVHHQYGIVLKTPPYRNQQIDEDVNVFVQLYRKNSPNKGRSEAVPFTYKPNRFKRKQARPSASIPTVVTSYEQFGNNSPSSSSSSIPGASDGENIHTSSQHQEQDDAEIINLILKITADGYESPTSDISSIVRELRGGYEIDAINHEAISPMEKLKFNDRLFDLLIKSINGDTYVFADLVENGKIEDIEKFTLLIVKYRLRSVLNSKNDIDQNVLHLAMQNGFYSMFRVFLNLGVNVNQSDVFGQTPLHLAVINESEEYVSALLAMKDVSLNTFNDKGETPLSLSVMNNHFNLTKLLIMAGADPRIKNPSNGYNCLHVAVNVPTPTYDMIKLLTEFDESMVYVESNSGKNVLELACANGLTQNIIDFLSTFKNDSTQFELDEICFDKLCKIFDSKDNWRYWAILMDFEEKIGEWEVLESPSRAMLTYLRNSKKSLEDLIGLFDLLNDSERASATTIIDEMIARKFEK